VTNLKAFREQLLPRLPEGIESPSGSQIELLERYYSLLQRWNTRINLTALPLDGFPAATLDRLIVEPVAAAKWVKDASSTWFDLGSGGGSPAIPLKVMRPALRLAMVESRGRKAAFLREVVRTLELDGTAVFSQRAEELAAEPVAHAKADVVSVRAVRMDDELVRAAMTLLKIDGRLLQFASAEMKPGKPRQLELMSQRDLGGTGARLFIWAKRP